jgi:hypothetical protein
MISLTHRKILFSRDKIAIMVAVLILTLTLRKKGKLKNIYIIFTEKEEKNQAMRFRCVTTCKHFFLPASCLEKTHITRQYRRQNYHLLFIKTITLTFNEH